MDFDQQPFIDAEFIENPEPRCPCILILDKSYSMSGDKLRALNAGISQFESEIKSDSLAAKRVEIAVVSFGPVTLDVDFSPAQQFYAPTLEPSGNTPIGEALETALNLLEARKSTYREAGVAMYRPWVFLITDGQPTDEWRAAADRISEGEAKKSFSFFAVGVDGANMSVLEKLSTRDPLRLKGLMFTELFQWLSSSLSSVSRSSVGDRIALPRPDGPSGWAEID